MKRLKVTTTQTRNAWIPGVWISALLLAIGTVQQDNRAALVIRFGEDRVETFCVPFDEEEITGYELLQRSGLAVEVEEVGMGVSVCRVTELGCSANNCFCQCQGGACEYWSYWLLRDGQWQYAVAGPSLSEVQHGDVQGWSWGAGSVSEAIAPPEMTFEEVCIPEPVATPVAEGSTPDSVAMTTPAGPMTVPPLSATTTESGSGQTGIPTSRVASYAVFGLLVLLLAVMAVAAYTRRQR